jgi:hypothetical protein
MSELRAAGLPPDFRLGTGPEAIISALEAYNWRAYHSWYQWKLRKAHGKRYLEWHAAYNRERRAAAAEARVRQQRSL